MRFKLKDFRESKKLFQSDMARIMNTNQSSISRGELRSVTTITYPQYELLCREFGKEEVDGFIVGDDFIEDGTIIIKGNKNVGGSQKNGIMTDTTALEIIREQSLALRKITEKQAEQTDRLLSLLEKISDK